jgi:hypothetical protein
MALPAMGAAPSGTYIESTAPNVREDLADIIYLIEKNQTPLVSALNRKESSQVLTEWLFQSLNAAANVPQPEGFTAIISPPTKPLRLNNVAQILARTVGVSDTLRVVDQVGDEEYSRQLMMRGLEVRRDMELTITGETIKTIADPRALSGIQTFCHAGSVGATGVVPVGDGSNGHTPGTLRDLTLNMIEDVVQIIWQAGGEPEMGVMSASIKRWFSTMAQPGASAANPVVQTQMLQSTTPSPVTINGAVAVFLTDFGPINLTPDRYMPPHVLIIVDTNYAELAPLPGRDIVEQEYGKQGDSQSGGVVWEGTLRVTAPTAHGCVWDLNQ